MAIDPDAFTTGLWRLDEPSNQGDLSQGSSTGNGTAGWRSKFGESGVLGVDVHSALDMSAAVNDPGSLLRFERNQAFSFSCWCSFAGGGGGATASVNNVLFSNAAVTTSRGFTFFTGLSRRLKMRLVNTTTTNEITVRTNAFQFEDGLVKHVVFTYDGSSTAAGCAIWVNGVSQSLTVEINNLSATIVSTGTLRLGRQGDVSSGANWIGTMRNAAFFNTALTGPQVAALFALGVDGNVPPQTGLQATWRLDRTDNYTATNGIVDYAGGSLGTFHATGVNGFGPHIAFMDTSVVSRGWGYVGGPKTAIAGRFVDMAIWFSNLSSMGSSAVNYGTSCGTGTSSLNNWKGWPARCFMGQSYTVEGWYYMDRAVNMCIFAYNSGGVSGGMNYFTLFILSTRAFFISWNDVPVRTMQSAAGLMPFQQWAHVAVTCTRSGGNTNVVIYVNGVSVFTGSNISPLFADDQNNLSNICNFGISQESGSPDQWYGGMAYVRLSARARTLSEIQAAALDPANIVNDVDTFEFYSMQYPIQIKDDSAYGHHLMPSGAYLGNTSGWTDAPFDGYGVTGPTFNDLAHQFINTSTNMMRAALVRQAIVDTWVGQNEATFETFLRMDQNLGNHQLMRLAGGLSSTVDTASNFAMQIDVLSNQALRTFWEGIGGYAYILRTQFSVIFQAATQSGEFGKFWCLAVRKRANGNMNTWLLNGTTHWVSMGNAAAYSFDRLIPWTLIIYIHRLNQSLAVETLIGKQSAADGSGYAVRLDASGRVEVIIANTGSAGFISKRVTTTSVADNIMHQIAVTYSGSSTAAGVNIYVDGVLQTMTTTTDTLASGTTVNTANFAVGSRNGVDRFFPGYVQQAAVYNRVLTLGEIQTTFGYQGAPMRNLLALSTASNLIGWWAFDQSDTSLVVDDKSVSGINGTPQNSLAPTARGSCLIDVYRNGVLRETMGPLPAAFVGDIYLAPDNNYTLSIHAGGEVDTRGLTRMSNKARSEEELIQFFEGGSGVPEPPVLTIEVDSPLPSTGGVIESNEAIVCHVFSTAPFVRIMLLISYEGFSFTEAVYTQSPQGVNGSEFEPLFAGSSVSLVVDDEQTIYRFEIRRTTPWPGSPTFRAYAFAGGAEL